MHGSQTLRSNLEIEIPNISPPQNFPRFWSPSRFTIKKKYKSRPFYPPIDSAAEAANLISQQKLN